MSKKGKIILSFLVIFVISLTGVLIWFVKTNKLGIFADKLRPAPTVKAYTLFPDFYLYEPVSFGLENIGSSSVTIKNSAPWEIKDNFNKTIYFPNSLPAMFTLAPGEKKEWSWNQKNDRGAQVNAGEYSVFFTDLKLSAPFKITRQIGSGGNFTFGFPTLKETKETLKIYINNPQSIREAIDNYYGKNSKNIPVGTLVDDRPGKSSYDSQWSWHLNPKSIVMGESAAELCDGLPSMVEGNLNYWLKEVKKFCPWGAKIIKLE